MKTEQEIKDKVIQLENIIKKLHQRSGTPGINIDIIRQNISDKRDEIKFLEWILE